MDEAIRAVAGQILDSPHVPDSVKAMFWMHATKSWIPGFRAVLISPLRAGLERHLAAPAGEWRGRMLYVPSAEFWMAHARSHPPHGMGCSPGTHVAFLTRDGANAEFGYYHLMEDGSLDLAGPEDFALECRHWESVFPGEGQGNATRGGTYGNGQAPYGGGY